MRVFLICAALAVLSGCGPRASSLEELTTREITLPGGQVIQAETAAGREEILRGLMFRPSLPANRGMLFVYRKPGGYSFWMYQTAMPLDMIWIDAGHRVVDIVSNAPPCKTRASQCAHYGGTVPASYILEINGGLAAKYGLRTGDVLKFD